MMRWTIVSTLLILTFSAPAPITRVTQAESPPEGRPPWIHLEDRRTVPITLGNTTIHAVIADTERARLRGLLGWTSITDDRGMLLDFMMDGVYAIHMEGMKFPIDALWINAAGVIKVIYENIKPNSGMVYSSMFPCRYCLELNAGFCKRHKVKMGQRVEFRITQGPVK